MILTLKGKITFTKPNTTIKFDHSFQKGMTVITGENEKGKSLRVELIRFAWFGTAALRSTRDQYQTIQVECSIQFGADVYKVERTLSNAKLFKNDVQQAIGTTPVNAAIGKLFGYDLSVFDTANCCMQGEIQALTKMKAGERKKMVDKTIGLDAIDALVKEAGDKISEQRKNIEFMEKRIDHSLVAPTPPQQYKFSGDWEDVIYQLQDRNIEKATLIKQIKAAECNEPDAVTPYDGPSVYELEELCNVCMDQQAVVERAVNLRGELSRIKEVPYTVEFLEQYMKDNIPYQWHQYKKYLSYQKACPVPKFPKEYIEIIEQADAQQEILNRIESLEQDQMHCPVCQVDFCVSHDKVTALKEQLDTDIDLAYWKQKKDHVIKEYKTFSQFKDAWKIHHSFLKCKPVEEPSTPEIEIYSSYLKSTIEGIKRRDEIAKLLEAADNEWDEFQLVTKGEDLPAVQWKLGRAREHQEHVKYYDQALAAYNAYMHTKLCGENRLNEIGDVQGDLTEAISRRKASTEYETRLQDYNLRVEVNARVQAEIDELKAKLDIMINVRAGLNNIKPKVKSYLVPSLNRVASNLLHQMTNGKRNAIDIDEEFNIIVDGQLVETLSGSAKAAANLAIRIGLGTVLTKKVFSVFMADEIDESMNDERAAYTAECLRNLTKVFDQVFLVTHKDVQGDHRIQL